MSKWGFFLGSMKGLPESDRGSNQELKDSTNYGEELLQRNKLRLIKTNIKPVDYIFYLYNMLHSKEDIDVLNFNLSIDIIK